MAGRSKPQDDGNTLYLDSKYSTFTFDELIERAMNYFDIDKAEAMVQLDIHAENIQIAGCGCHYNPSDWVSYIVITRNTPATVVSEDAQLVAEASSDAYSAGNYANGHWAKCAQELLNRGLTLKETEDFLRSKHMRWCYDNAENPSQTTVVEFRKYLDSGRNLSGRTLKQEAARLSN